MVKVLCICLFLLAIAGDLCSGIRIGDHTQQHGGFVYTRDELLRLRPPPPPPSSQPLMPTVNTTQDASKKRKRGRRGGVKNRLRRRPAKPPHHPVRTELRSRVRREEGVCASTLTIGGAPTLKYTPHSVHRTWNC